MEVEDYSFESLHVWAV